MPSESWLSWLLSLFSKSKIEPKPQPKPEQKPEPKPQPKPQPKPIDFVVGVNLPWIDGQYDHDFGSNQIRGQDLGQELKSAYPNYRINFENYIKDISSIGIKIVRLWLFERFEGLRFSNDGKVIEITVDFLMNLRDACEIAQKHEIKFYFCLMDTWGTTSSDLNEVQKERYKDIMNGLITTKEKRQSFLDVVCQVLSDKMIAKSVWAIDVLNEPEGIEREKILKDRKIDTKIVWPQLLDYINDACDQIKKRTGYKVSCGFQQSENLEKFKSKIASSVDFFDFHVYNDSGNVPNLKNLGLTKPCYIGECGQEEKKYDDQIQKTAVKNFLQNSKNQGYSGCMIWQYGYRNNQTSYDRYYYLIDNNGNHRPVVDEIKKFVFS